MSADGASGGAGSAFVAAGVRSPYGTDGGVATALQPHRSGPSGSRTQQQEDATLESIIGRASSTAPASSARSAASKLESAASTASVMTANGANATSSSASAVLDQTVHARQAISPWLHFRDARLEQLFLVDYFDKYLFAIRRSIIIATMMWVLFVINDIIKNGEGKRRYFGATLALRFGAMALVCLALLVTYSKHFGRRGLSWLVATVVILFGTAQILSGVIEQDTLDPTYSVAVVLISSTSSAFFRLPCWASVSTNAAMYALYVLLTGVTGSYSTGTHFGTTCMWLAIGVAIFSLHAYDREWYIRSSYLAQRRLEYEEHKSQRVLLKMLPASVIAELRTGAEFMHERHSNISVLFSHICDFDEHTSSMSPAEVIGLLNRVFSRFDQITDEWGVYKVETIGDVYLISAGVPEPMLDHANALAHVAVSMMEALPEFQSEERLLPVQLKIGIHSGPVIAGVVGMKYPRFRLMGDTVNTASRMSSTCAAGDIQLSPSAFQQLHADEFVVQYRGEIEVKGKGRMKTYLVRGRTHKLDPLVLSKRAAAAHAHAHAHAAAVAAAAAIASTPSMHGLGLTYTPRTPVAATLTLADMNATPIASGRASLTHPTHARNPTRPSAAAAAAAATQSAKWTDGLGDSGGSMRLTDPTRLHAEISPQHEWPATQDETGAGAGAGAGVAVASAAAAASPAASASAERGSMRIQLPGHRSFLEPVATAAAASAGTGAGASAGTSGPVPSTHPRGSSSSSAVASLNNGAGGVMLEEFSIVPDFADTQTPLATYRERLALGTFGQNTPRDPPHTQPDPASSSTLLTPAISSALLSPPLAAPLSTVAPDGTGVGGADPAPGDHVQPTGAIGPNEVTRLSSVVAKGGRHALIKQKSVMGSSEISVSTVESIDQPDGEVPAATASALSSVHGAGAGTARDILRITAKEVQRGGGNGGLFSSSMEWDSLVDARNPFNLRFVHDPELEAQFQADFFRRFLEPNRRGLLAFVVALLLLGIYETLLNLPDSASESRTMEVTWILRAVGLAVGVALYTLTHTHRSLYERWQQPILTGAWAFMGCMLLTILVQLDSYAQVYGVTSVLLLLTMTSTFVGLQFLWVALVTVFFLLWYLGSALVVYQTFPLMVFFLLASNVLAITAARSSEYYLRWDFIRHLKLQVEERRTRHFLDNMLPKSVIAEIKQLSLDPAFAGGAGSARGSVGSVNRFIAHEFQHASVMFSDIVSFTSLAARIRPEDVVAILNVMFSTFDALTTKHNVFKVETIGDAYLACSGVVHRSASQTEDLVKFALDLQTSTKYMQTPDGQPIVIRIGIHTGSVVAGVVGRKMPRYHLFGETVTISEEMEQNGIPGQVVISAATHAECEGFFQVERLDPMTLHAKPAKNVMPSDAAQVAPLLPQHSMSQLSQLHSAVAPSATSSAPLYSGDGVSCSALTCDDSRLVHRYRVICHLGSMAPHRGGGGGGAGTGRGPKAFSGLEHASTASVSGAIGGPVFSAYPSSRQGTRRGSRTGFDDATLALSHSRPSSAAARAEEFDRAPPPFVAQILGRINAKNFADNHERLERNQEKIRSALEAAQAEALSKPPVRAYDATNVLPIYAAQAAAPSPQHAAPSPLYGRVL